MTRTFTLLLNPLSGGSEQVAPVLARLSAAGARVTRVETSSPLDVPGVVAAAVERGDVVVAAGGDGTLSSVVGPVSEAGATLGILPAGRGNDFARMLDLPASPAELADVLLSGTERLVDLVSYAPPGGPARRVAGSVYAGVDARVSDLVAGMHRLPRPLHYPVASVRAILAYRPARYEVVVDGTAHTFDAATVVTANSGYYGQGMRIAPAAALDDGLLDVIVIAARTKTYLLRSFPKMYDGSHVSLDAVTVLTGRRVTLTATTPVPVGGDGEPLGALSAAPTTIEVLPGALRVLVAGRAVA